MRIAGGVHGRMNVRGVLAGAFLAVCSSASAAVPSGVPALMTCEDGSSVTDVSAWEGRRRGEILEFFTREVYGRRPVGRPDGLRFERIEPDKVMMAGKAVRKRIRASWKGPHGMWSFGFTAFVPKAAAVGRKPAPSFVLICNRPPDENIDPARVRKSYFWPAEEIVDRGNCVLQRRHRPGPAQSRVHQRRLPALWQTRRGRLGGAFRLGLGRVAHHGLDRERAVA